MMKTDMTAQELLDQTHASDKDDPLDNELVREIDFMLKEETKLEKSPN